MDHPSLILFGMMMILTQLTACNSSTQASSSNQPATIDDPLLLEAWALLNEYR